MGKHVEAYQNKSSSHRSLSPQGYALLAQLMKDIVDNKPDASNKFAAEVLSLPMVWRAAQKVSDREWAKAGQEGACDPQIAQAAVCDALHSLLGKKEELAEWALKKNRCWSIFYTNLSHAFHDTIKRNIASEVVYREVLKALELKPDNPHAPDTMEIAGYNLEAERWVDAIDKLSSDALKGNREYGGVLRGCLLEEPYSETAKKLRISPKRIPTLRREGLDRLRNLLDPSHTASPSL
jgi:hypothetical protein